MGEDNMKTSSHKKIIIFIVLALIIVVLVWVLFICLLDIKEKEHFKQMYLSGCENCSSHFCHGFSLFDFAAKLHTFSEKTYICTQNNA